MEDVRISSEEIKDEDNVR